VPGKQHFCLAVPWVVGHLPPCRCAVECRRRCDRGRWYTAAGFVAVVPAVVDSIITSRA